MALSKNEVANLRAKSVYGPIESKEILDSHEELRDDCVELISVIRQCDGEVVDQFKPRLEKIIETIDVSPASAAQPFQPT